MSDIKIDDIISLVNQNYNFLHLGKFLDEYIKRNDLSEKAKTIDIHTLPNGYKLRDTVTKDLLKTVFNNRDKTSFFGYLIVWNAFRGIMMAVHEGKTNKHFKSYLENKLAPEKFKHFECIVSFTRNVLSHNIDDEIRLRDTDFKDTKKYFLKTVCKTGHAKLDILYSDIFPELEVPSGYGFSVTVDFAGIKAKDRFIDIMSEYQLYMLSEFCFNLCNSYK